MKEIWKDAMGYEGIYQVSDKGRVKSLDRVRPGGGKIQGKLMKQAKESNGYMRITLCKDGKKKRFGIHRLVAQAFVSNDLLKPEVNHRDENKCNNAAENLEWVTNKENIRYGTGIKRKAEALSKPVIAIHKETSEKIRYSSFKKAEENGFNRRNIYSCLVGKLKHHKGYSWNYE